MATDFNVQIKVDPANAVRNTKKVENALGGVATKADRLRNTLTGAFAFIGVGAAISQILKLADTYTELQNKLRVVTTGTQQLVDVTEELYNIAQRTRSALGGTVDMYSRVALATKEMGIESQQLLNFTESLNQAIIVSGATAAEAQNALIQFSQGLASGTLRGDELRSVLEQLPFVADVLGKELGVTRGELRKMGTEGKITSEVILRAFKNMRGEIAEKFAKTIPTLAQSFIILKNSVIKTFGEMSTNLGVTGTLAQGVILLSQNVDTLVRSLGALSIVLGISLAAKAIPAVISGLKALRIAMLANPITAFAVVLTTIISLLVTFSDKITFGADGFVTLKDTAIATFQIITERLQPLIKFMGEGLTDAIGTVKSTMSGLGITFNDVLNAAKFSVNKTIGLYVGLGKSIGVVFKEIGDFAVKIFRNQITQTIIKTLNSLLTFVRNKFVSLVSVVSESLNILGIKIKELGKAIDVKFELPDVEVPPGVIEFGTKISDAFLDGLHRDYVGEITRFVTPAFEEVSKRAAEISAKRRKAAEDASKNVGVTSGAIKVTKVDKGFEKLIAALEQERKLLSLSNEERVIQEGLLSAEKDLKRDLTDIESSLIESMLRENEALKLQNSLYDQIKGPINEYQQTLEGLDALLQKNIISQNEYNAALQQTSLAGSLQEVQSFLGTDEENELQLLSDRLIERQNLTNQFLEAELINATEHKSMMLQLEEKYNNDVKNIELSRYKLQLSAGQQTFSALAQVTKGFAGEQSSAYRAMFAISKGFAVAQSALAIQQGIAEAIKLGWPANIPAIAGVISQGAQIVSTIQGTQPQGFQNGGSFGVGGSGGTDSQLVQFRATPNETVSVRTPGQERLSNRNTDPQPQQQQALNVINVLDPAIVGEYLNSPDGERTLVNSIQSNQTQIRGVMGRN